MNAKKHTPGPWLRDDCSGLDCDANAHLIAAAPELLEVAQLILAEDLLDFLPEEYASKVRAAVAKATGDAQ